MRPLLAVLLFKTADTLIALAKAIQLLGFITLSGRNWRDERDACYREGLTQAHFRMQQP